MRSDLYLIGKTYNSIIAHIARGGSHKSRRGYELIDRYNGLKTKLLHSNQDGWRAHCAGTNSDITHDGYDFFA